MRKTHNWMRDRDAEIAEASLASRRAILIGADNPAVLAWAGHVLSMVVGDLETGGATCERAVALSPNYAPALADSSFAKIWAGEPQVAIERLSLSVRLSPLDPSLPWWRNDSGRFPALVRELIALHPAVIVTAGTPAATAVVDATKAIPCVMVAVGDPVGTGLIKSSAHPGGSLHPGPSSIAPEAQRQAPCAPARGNPEPFAGRRLLES